MTFDAFEEYRPVILCNVSQFGFVCYFFLIRLVVMHLWQKYNKSIMLRFSFCIPLCGHDINLSHFVGFKFIYLIKEVSASLFPCKDILLHFVKNFWGCDSRVVLKNHFFFEWLVYSFSFNRPMVFYFSPWIMICYHHLLVFIDVKYK